MRTKISLIGLLMLVCCRPAVPAGLTAIPLPDGRPGIGFDDLRYSPALGRIVAPAGRTGRVDLVDPDSHAVTDIAGFSTGILFLGGHDEGPTSADEGNGLLYVTDRSTRLVHVVDPAVRRSIGSASVASSPDYVRYVAATNEVWITEPDMARIEVFSVASRTQSVLAGSISVPGGPESLVIDRTRGRAYTHLWAGGTVAIDVHTRAITEQYPNGCVDSRGIALDEARGFLFAGCLEGKAVALDVKSGGKIAGSVTSGDGVDVIDYSPRLHHLYLPGASSETMAVVGVSDAGALAVLGTTPTVQDAHCVAADDRGNAYLCDQQNGQLLVFADPYPAALP